MGRRLAFLAPGRSPEGRWRGDLLVGHPTIDRVLDQSLEVLGDDATGYRHHVYRVTNLCLALAPSARGQVEKLAVAAVFHDLGIWTDRTFDYVEPSVRLAEAHLALANQSDWGPEIASMIRDHHKVSASRQDPHWLVEPFRQADWIDVTIGLRRFGLSRREARQIFGAWPNAGFHQCLARLTLSRFLRHPLSPLPMMKL